MPVTTPPALSAIPAFPALSERAAGTYNANAYACLNHWAATGGPQLAALADNVFDNATEAHADAVATAADRVQTGLDRAAAADSAAQAAAVVATIPEGTINDGTTSGASVWSSSKVSTELGGKQAALVTGTNIKTINGASVLGSGDIAVGGDATGSIKYSYTSPGAGWLECNGAVYLQSSYASLYAAVGLLPNSHNRQAQANMSSTSAPTAVADTPEYVSNLVNTGSAIVIVVSRLTGSTYSWAYRSTNSGVTWTRTAMPAVVGYGRLSFGNGRLIASIDPSLNSTTYATSDDGGSTWTARTFPSSNSVRDVVYGNRWVACRGGAASLWSDDGISWTAVTSDGSNEFDQAAFGNSVWSANRSGAQVISSDGKAWTTVSGVTITLDASSTNRHRKKLLFAGGTFWAVGNYSGSGGYPGSSTSWQLLRSTDGQNWRQAYAPMRYLNSSAQTSVASAIDPSADFDNPHLFAGLGYLGIAGRTRNGIPGAVVTDDFVSFEYLYFSGHSSYSGNADLSPAPFSCNDKFGTWTWESSLNPYVMRETQARITYSTSTQFAVPHIVPGTDGRRAYIKA